MKSRALNSVRNTIYAFFAQFLTSIAGFITRTVFIYTLGNAYLGLNGLFSDILSLLSLAELGFGTAITYSMYKPVAENDEKKISALLSLYRRIYISIGLLMTIVGLVLIPFLDFFISDMPTLDEIPIIYMLYLFNSSFSYFYVYKKSLLIATQNVHISSRIQIAVILVQNVLQIISLIIFHNFLVYLFIQVVCTLLNNIMISSYVDKNYAYLKKYRNEKLDSVTKKEISKNVFAMFLSKISSVGVTSTDNILISMYVSTIVLGYYSNYIWFTTLIRMIFNKFFESIIGSVGNLLALENSEKSYNTYQKIWFANFWLIGFCSIALFILINPFIELWIGKSYLLNTEIVFFISLNLFMRFIRNTSLTYIDTYGLFWNVKWKSLIEVVVNLSASIFYLKVLDLGILGVLLGTFTSNIATNFWYEPYVIYSNKFNRPLKEYYIRFIKYISVTIFTGLVTYFTLVMVTFDNQVVNFIFDLFLCIILINFIFSLFFRKTDEYKYFVNLVITVVPLFKKK